MNILAIDTANSRCSAAVARGDDQGVVFRRSEEISRGHAERLMDMIGEVLAEAGLAMTDLDRIAVTVGPGSFTGLRVGLSVARGLGLVLGVPVVGVSTLVANAETVRDGVHPVAVALSARAPEIYAQVFAPDGAALCEGAVYPIDAFGALVPQGVLVAGSAAGDLLRVLPADLDAVLGREDAGADIGAVLSLGREMDAPVSAPAPLYLRPPDAKPQTRFKIARR